MDGLQKNVKEKKSNAPHDPNNLEKSAEKYKNLQPTLHNLHWVRLFFWQTFFLSCFVNRSQ